MIGSRPSLSAKFLWAFGRHPGQRGCGRPNQKLAEPVRDLTGRSEAA